MLKSYHCSSGGSVLSQVLPGLGQAHTVYTQHTYYTVHCVRVMSNLGTSIYILY